MSILLFLVAIVVSFIVVRIGVVAFQLTGLEWSVAKFQSLSCFSGTGFTTKEAELISENEQRRKIASILMVLGNAGIVTLIATFANTLGTESFTPNLLPWVKDLFPKGIMPWVDLFLIVGLLYIVYRMFSRSSLSTALTEYIRAKMIQRETVKRVTFEELMVSTGGYGVSTTEICEGSPLIEKNLYDSGLRQLDITVLAIERKGKMIPNPPAAMKILLHDRIVCFGKLGNIRKEFNVCEGGRR